MNKNANITQKSNHCKNIHWFDEIDSTNVRLMADKESKVSGTIYSALFQTSGRGQRGNRWDARSGENLTFSLLYRPENLPASRQFVICQAAALAVTAFMDKFGINADIKWPNDIFVNDRKICGMLIEHSISEGKVASSIIGIGLNLNQSCFPAELSKATSISLVTGCNYDLKSELECISDILLDILEESSTEEGRRNIREAYMERLYRKGQWHLYVDRSNCDTLVPTTENVEGKRFEGRITGVDDNGCVIIEDKEDGEKKSFAFKELSYII